MSVDPKAFIQDFTEEVKQLCRDFSDRNDRPYMLDVSASLEALQERTLQHLEAQSQAKPGTPPPAPPRPEITKLDRSMRHIKAAAEYLEKAKSCSTFTDANIAVAAARKHLAYFAGEEKEHCDKA